MARGRMLATTIADDKRFNALPVDAALVYLMTIPQLDRDGLILGEPMSLWGQVCRRRPDLIDRMAVIIEAWISCGLVVPYTTDDDDRILYFAGFQKNQSMTHYGREAESRFPCPPGYVRTDKGLTPDKSYSDDDMPADELRTNSGLTPDEVQPNINKRNINKENGNAADASSSLLNPELGAVYACWDDNMGVLSPLLSDQLNELVTTYTAKEVIRAIGIAVNANVRNMKYVTGVLRNRAAGDDGKRSNGAKPKTKMTPLLDANGQPVIENGVIKTQEVQF